MPTGNAFAVLPPPLIRELDEIGKSHTVDGMLAWTKCRMIGEVFGRHDKSLHRAMRRYLASEYRLSRNQIGNHFAVWLITRDLPDETLELVPWSVAHAIRKRHRDDLQSARAELLDLIDNDRSLVAQRLEALKAAQKAERATTLRSALNAAMRPHRAYWGAQVGTDDYLRGLHLLAQAIRAMLDEAAG